MDCLTLLLGAISAFAAVIGAIFAYKAYLSGKTPKLVLETPDNAGLFLRNIGTDTAKNITETTKTFRDIPLEIWNFNGPIDYLRVKSPGVSRMINFSSEKEIPPSTSTIVRFEYENSDGDKFFSEIKIERRPETQQHWYQTPTLIKSSKI